MHQAVARAGPGVGEQAGLAIGRGDAMVMARRVQDQRARRVDADVVLGRVAGDAVGAGPIDGGRNATGGLPLSGKPTAVASKPGRGW